MYTDPVVANPVNQMKSMQDLVTAMAAGQVELILILGGNPLYDAPVDLEFGAALAKVPLRIHMGLYADETAGQCQWQIPASHYLESWSDARARRDGYDPAAADRAFYASRSPHELLDALLSDKPRQIMMWSRDIGASKRGRQISTDSGRPPCTMAWWQIRRCRQRALPCRT